MIMFSLPFKMILRQIAREYMRRQFPEYVKKYPRIACYSSDYISLKILLDGLHEARELDFLGSKIFPRLDRRRTCVDVGANIGNHALYFSRFFEKVVALEPDRRAYRLLRFNSESADNIVPLNLGCSNVKRTARAVESQVTHGDT